jgi:hypothetical protein
MLHGDKPTTGSTHRRRSETQEEDHMTRARITRLIVMPAAILSLAGAAAATQHRIAPAASSAVDQVRAAERTVLRAEVNANTKTLRAVLAPNFQLIDVTGSAESRSVFFSVIGGPVDFKQLKPLTPIHVRVYGNAAVARVKLAFKVVARGTKLQHRGWNTDLFERRGGRWLLVWSQTTPQPNNFAFLLKALEPPQH